MDINKAIKTLDNIIKQSIALKLDMQESNRTTIDSSQSAIFTLESVPRGTLGMLNDVHLVFEYFIKKKGYNKAYKRSDFRIKLIKNVLKYSNVEEIKKVIDSRFIEWKEDKVMKNSLTLETILRPSNYPKYVDVLEDSKCKAGISINIGEKRNIHA